MIRRSNVPTTRNLLDSIFEDDWGFAPIFNSLLREAPPQIKTNITASDSDYRIDVVIPGLEKSDISIDVNEATIAISYDAKEETNNFMSYSSFHRSWALPKNVDPGNIIAEYKQGILSVFVPRETPATNSIKIDIK